jgi:hypothetical protein
MHFHDFIKFILEFQRVSKLPAPHRYPSDLRLDSYTWDEIYKLYKFTSPYNYEYSSSLYWIDGDIIFTKPVKGSKTKVFSRDQLQLKYSPTKPDHFEKQILVNGKVIKKVTNIRTIPEKPTITPVFTIHTHPKHVNHDREYYSFFSETDINTLFSSPFLCVGLITDKFLLACKHSQSSRNLSQEQKQILSQINISLINNSPLNAELIQDLGIILYSGNFRKQLIRI